MNRVQPVYRPQPIIRTPIQGDPHARKGGHSDMNWTHLISQVECMVIDSQATPEEFKEILDASDWYKHEAWRNEKWWFGRGTGKAELTFEGIIAMFDWMGLDKVIVEAMRMQIESMVDELIVNEHMVEPNEMVKEEAA